MLCNADVISSNNQTFNMLIIFLTYLRDSYVEENNFYNCKFSSQKFRGCISRRVTKGA